MIIFYQNMPAEETSVISATGVAEMFNSAYASAWARAVEAKESFEKARFRAEIARAEENLRCLDGGRPAYAAGDIRWEDEPPPFQDEGFGPHGKTMVYESGTGTEYLFRYSVRDSRPEFLLVGRRWLEGCEPHSSWPVPVETYTYTV